MILIHEVQFSSTPIGKLHVREDGLSDAWLDINFFCEKYHCELRQVVTAEGRERYSPQRYVGIFERWEATTLERPTTLPEVDYQAALAQEEDFDAHL